MDKKEQIKKAIENSYKYTSAGFLIDHDILADKILALSQPKEVDLEELKEQWIKFCTDNKLNGVIKGWNFFLPKIQNNNNQQIKIQRYEITEDGHRYEHHNGAFVLFDEVKNTLPHLQKPVESDAVEFATYLITQTEYIRSMPDCWFKSIDEPIKTTQELYEQFKQLKK